MQRVLSRGTSARAAASSENEEASRSSQGVVYYEGVSSGASVALGRPGRRGSEGNGCDMVRKASWFDTIPAVAPASGAQSIISLMGGVLPLDSRGYTLTRTIVDVNLAPPTAVSDGQQIVSMGIGLVSQEAFVAGVVPDPNVALDRPARGWVWRTQVIVAGAASMVSHVPWTIRADLRGMRRVDDGELVLIVNNDALDGTSFAVFVRGIVRCAFLLP